jgi:pimeloyl-ACP methyl ester carboxylesterase
MPLIDVNGIRLNSMQMACRRSDGREALVMVHGLATNLAFWALNYAPVFSEHYKVIIYDLRGHGRSDMPASGYTPIEMAADLGKLLDHYGIDRAHIISHSFGGSVALNFACQQPERVASLVLLDTHIGAVRRLKSDNQWEFGKKLQPKLSKLGIRIDTQEPYVGLRLLTEMARMQINTANVPPGLNELVGPLVGKFGKRTAQQWLRLMEATTAENELMGDDGLSLENLRRLKLPILAMYGEHSQSMTTGMKLLDVWPDAYFRRVLGGGHFFPVTRSYEIIKACENFWQYEINHTVQRRKGEYGRNFFRSDRVVTRNGELFMLTREKVEIGPFSNVEEANDYIGGYISAQHRNASLGAVNE